MKKTLFTTAVMFCSIVLCAESISLPLEKLSLKPLTGHTQATVTAKDGIISMSGPIRLESKEKFTIDPAKKYRISFQARAVKGSPKATLSVGFIPLSNKNREICGMNVCCNPKTTGTLVADLKKGDKTLQIKPDEGSTGWNVKGDWYLAAVNVKKDGSDLPAYQLIRGIVKNEVKDGILTITVSTPSRYAAKAGTAVRIHRGGGDFMYTASRANKFTEEWTPFIGTVTGVMESSDRTGFTGWSYNAWPKQAVSCRILVLGNWVNDNAKVEIRDLKLDILD